MMGQRNPDAEGDRMILMWYREVCGGEHMASIYALYMENLSPVTRCDLISSSILFLMHILLLEIQLTHRLVPCRRLLMFWYFGHILRLWTLILMFLDLLGSLWKSLQLETDTISGVHSYLCLNNVGCRSVGVFGVSFAADEIRNSIWFRIQNKNDVHVILIHRYVQFSLYNLYISLNSRSFWNYICSYGLAKYSSKRLRQINWAFVWFLV